MCNSIKHARVFGIHIALLCWPETIIYIFTQAVGCQSLFSYFHLKRIQQTVHDNLAGIISKQQIESEVDSSIINLRLPVH